MAERSVPYSQFNFLVDLGGGEGTDSVKAGFQEVSGLGVEINVAEYRRGNYNDNAPQKVPGTYKVADVTLKRGLMGAADLFNWVKETRQGGGLSDAGFGRTVTITLLSEDRETTAATWTLKNAFPKKYTAPALNGKGTDVAVEELVLTCERVDMEE